MQWSTVVRPGGQEAEGRGRLLGLGEGGFFAGELGGGGPGDVPELPSVADLLHDGSEVHGREGLARIGEWRPRHEVFSVDLIVDGADHLEGVLIEAHPEVDAVLLDAVVDVAIATGGAFAAETPTHLIDGDVIALLPIGIVGELD